MSLALTNQRTATLTYHMGEHYPYKVFDIGEIVVILEESQSYYFKVLYEDKIYIMSKQSVTRFDGNKSLAGKTFCITGPLSRLREYYMKLIAICGGHYKNTVGNQTDYLVTNQPTSGSIKARKARSLGIPMLSEKQLLLLIQQKA